MHIYLGQDIVYFYIHRWDWETSIEEMTCNKQVLYLVCVESH